MYMAFVLLKVEGRKFIEVAEQLSQLPEILALYAITGDYDMMVVLSTDEYEKIGHTIIEKILTVPGVIESKTYMTFREFLRRW